MNQGQVSARTAVAIGLSLLLLPLGSWAGPEIGTRYFFHDHLGSVVVESDATGGVTARTDYRPWGEAKPIGDDGARPRFTGKARDSATGLYYYEARYVRPETSRFVSPDPAQQISSVYTYAGDAPLLNVDQDGREFTEYERALLSGYLSSSEVHVHESGGVSVKRVPMQADILLARATIMNANSITKSPLFVRDVNRENLVNAKVWGQYPIFSRLFSVGVVDSLHRDLMELRSDLVAEHEPYFTDGAFVESLRLKRRDMAHKFQLWRQLDYLKLAEKPPARANQLESRKDVAWANFKTAQREYRAIGKEWAAHKKKWEQLREWRQEPKSHIGRLDELTNEIGNHRITLVNAFRFR